MKKVALFPGSFDPITKGHQSIIERAIPLFDKIIIAIGINSTKKELFTVEQRKKMIQKVFEKKSGIIVTSYSGLTIDYCKKMNVQYILRGLRTSADFDYERSIAQMNKQMLPEIDTIFMVTIPELSSINSSIVREILLYGGDITSFVPKEIINMIKKLKYEIHKP